LDKLIPILGSAIQLSKVINRLLIYLCGFLAFIPTVYASGWQVFDYPDGRGSNAGVNIRLQNVTRPSWATLIIDYGIVRNCSAGLGLLVYTRRNLGASQGVKKNPNVLIDIDIDGKRWTQNANFLRSYQYGFEVGSVVNGQEQLNAIASGREATVTIFVGGERKIGVAFDIRGGISAINSAYHRCKKLTR
jgi:hypothetical protein